MSMSREYIVQVKRTIIYTIHLILFIDDRFIYLTLIGVNRANCPSKSSVVIELSKLRTEKQRNSVFQLFIIH